VMATATAMIVSARNGFIGTRAGRRVLFRVILVGGWDARRRLPARRVSPAVDGLETTAVGCARLEAAG
jgi:hypothetical protein